MRTLLTGLLTLVPLCTSFASSEVIYRDPQSYGELSAPVISSLKKEGCRIPQGTIDGKVVAANVISGAFAAEGQSDRAVLCAENGRQYIRVFWGGTASCPSRIDKGRMVTRAELKQGLEFDRAIGLADRKFILDHFEAYGGAKPPKITHLGINYAFLGKASVVHYCHEGRWQELSGAD